jgi:hypothetical protein
MLVTCALCGETMDATVILGHLRGEHGIEEELATWPDGEYVVIDKTLEPDDFKPSQ